MYLGNRFVQFAHARCLREETEALGTNTGETPAGVRWPEGFSGILNVAREGYPREFDAMAAIGGDAPHFNYPLRQLGDLNVEIQQGSSGFLREVGDMAYQQAIREAYPGATYLHMGQLYKVNQWSQGFNKLSIRVRPVPNAAFTSPMLRKSVTIDLSREGIISEHIKTGPRGLLAEAHVQVNERVEGYTIGNISHPYREERIRDPNMRPKQRDFRTTGVVIKIEDDWFSEASVRREVAYGLRDLLARERSIAPQDIDAVHTNIAVVTATGRQHMTDIVVIYDSVYGGLRLTENLFDDFRQYIERLKLGAGLSQGDGIVTSDTAENLGNWNQSLPEGFSELVDIDAPDVPEGWLQVFKQGSLVGILSQGTIVERELIEPRMIDDPFNPGRRVLYYTYRDDTGRGVVASTPGSAIQQVGHDWEWVLWNPVTGEFRDLETSE